MKKLILILFAFIILGCDQNLKKKGVLLGTWDAISATDIETGEVSFPESDELAFVEFKSDSLYLSPDLSLGDKVFAWRIEGDSIVLFDEGNVYIKELTKNKLVVEYDFFGKTQLNFKKRK
ncbi:hypothetical protein [Tamlana flava]|uniref:hypothetical protein n=1 Tax=Tamlana flava TaxID=3158572 RepID=UPI00351B8978